MKVFRFLTVASLATLAIASVLYDVNAEPLRTVSRMVSSNVSRISLEPKETDVTKKPYVAKEDDDTHNNDYTENGSSNLCPCHLNSAEGSRCYDFMNQAVGTCHMRPCTDGFVCTSRRYATHYCFEKTSYAMKVLYVGAGHCKTKRERLTFRVPYVDIVQRADEREKELNYDTLIRDDVGDMEPEACLAL